MKGFRLVSAMLALVLAFGFAFVSCGDDSGSNSGGSGGGSSITYYYTVYYSVGTGSGTAPSSETVASGTRIYLPGQRNMIAPSGQTFSGWRRSGGADYDVGEGYYVYSDTTFIAQWRTSSSGGTGTGGGTSNLPTTPVAGSSSSNAITISSSSISGSFPSGLDAVWYKFTKSGSGMFAASDRDYSSVYTGDIVVDVYNSSLSLLSGPIVDRSGTILSNSTWYDIDVGNNVRLYATNWSGTYYVRVRPYNNNNTNKGTFALLIQ